MKDKVISPVPIFPWSGKKGSKDKVLFIGANDMREIVDYKHQYKEGLFIEPIPQAFDLLTKNLEEVNNSNGNNFKALQALVTNKDGQVYDFHLYNNDLYVSSSIFKMREEEQNRLGYKETIKLTSKRMSTIISSFNLNIKDYDVFVDVQGAELEVLKSFDHHINEIDWLKTEVSTSAIYYDGVLFDELNSFLNQHNLFTNDVAHGHMDVIYEKNNLTNQ